MDSTAIANQIAEYDKNRKSSTDVLNQAMSQYGIPEIRSRVAGLRTTLSNTENALNNVDPSVTGRTQGSLVTEAQRQHQVADERAPIADQYGQQSRALATESANQSDALSAAKLLAENQINDYNTGRSALQSRYDTTYKREQDQKAADLAAKQLAANSSGYNLGGGATSATPATGARSVQRSDKGYNFTDASGQSISAAQYAAATGTPFRTVLQEMAKNGDKGAAAALGFVGNDYGYDPTKIGGNGDLYNALVWGTGKQFTGGAGGTTLKSYAGLSSGPRVVNGLQFR